MEQKIVNFSEIDPEFNDAPKFSNIDWKNVMYYERYVFTRYAEVCLDREHFTF
jgi:hypothetical protein